MQNPQTLLLGLSILLLAFYLPGFLNSKKAMKAFKSFAKSKESLRIGSISIFLISYLFLSTHWEFTGEWMMTISIIGWLMFIKGLVWLWAPDFVQKKAKEMSKHENLVATFSVVGILFSVSLSYIALNLI